MMQRLVRTAVPLVLLAAMAAGCGGGGDENSLDFILAYDDQVEVEKGDPVVNKGFRIGSVRSVGLDDEGYVAVHLRIDGKYAGVPYREADYVITEKEFDGKKRRLIEMRDRDVPEKTPVRSGDVIEPLQGWSERARRSMEEATERSKEAARKMWEGARGVMDDIGDYARSEEARELRDSINQFFEDSSEKGAEFFQELKEERYPEIRKKAEEYRQWLIDQGLPEKAEKFWNDFLEWSKGLVAPEQQ